MKYIIAGFLILFSLPGFSQAGITYRADTLWLFTSPTDSVQLNRLPRVWGQLTGDISNQTDLNSAISGKQPVNTNLTSIAALANGSGFLKNNGSGTFTYESPAGSGTVTDVSVVSANGFAGSVATSTSTPAITLSTTITGVLKGNGTAISAASAGTDYLAPNGNGSALIGLTASQVGLGNVENTALSTWTGTSNINTVGTVATGTWNATAIGVSKGGTGATTASAGFLALAPTVTGNAHKYLKVNAGATDYELVTLAGGGDLMAANNLSDLANAATARTNLALGNVDNTSNATERAATATLTNKTISGASNTLSNIATSSITGYAGFTINVHALTSSPADGATTYFGVLPKAPTTTASISKVYVRTAGTITAAEIYTYSGTAGTNEAWSMYIRVNSTTDYLIQTVSASTNERVFSNSGLNISLNANDYFEIKSVQPTWGTNPLTTIYGGYVKIN